MASNRILLINEEIQKELSALLRTVKDPRVQDVMISITRVETTPDLRYTKVYVSFLQEDKAADAIEAAVQQVLTEGYRTGDIFSEGCTKVGCKEMGELIASRVK